MPSFQFNFGNPTAASRRVLTRRTTFLLLLFGLTLLLIHLGDRRVLTRHEVFAAQPGREMLHDGTFSRWMLPMLAGAPREAKPPGMMWLIAASIYVFRSESEWVARLPSALAGMYIALLMARMAARWFGDRIGRLAGLLQLTFVYTIMQAKLAEADMCLAAAVCTALYCVAVAVIDSPFGFERSGANRLRFWLAAGAAFLLKGPIGLVFIGLALAAYIAIQYRAGERDWRVLKFLLYLPGIICFILLLVAWPLLAWRLDPTIVHTWNSEVVGSATGKFGSDPIYYYLGSVPLMLMPWTAFTLIGLRRGPNPELAGPVAAQTQRIVLWRFLLCWFVPGIIFLSFGMALKSHHYGFPILPPLTIPTALGLDYYVRRQSARKQGLVWPFFLAGCCGAAALIWKLPQIPHPLKAPLAMLIAILAAGGLISLHYERQRRPNAVIAAYLLTAWAIGVGVQSWVMPAQDDYRYQAQFARYVVNAAVPPGAIVYVLGHREEEQEAEYTYYLRFPMQRLAGADDFAAAVKSSPDGQGYAIAPAGFVSELKRIGTVQTIAKCEGLRAKETEADRLCLLRVDENK